MFCRFSCKNESSVCRLINWKIIVLKIVCLLRLLSGDWNHATIKQSLQNLTTQQQLQQQQMPQEQQWQQQEQQKQLRRQTSRTQFVAKQILHKNVLLVFVIKIAPNCVVTLVTTATAAGETLSTDDGQLSPNVRRTRSGSRRWYETSLCPCPLAVSLLRSNNEH